MHVSIDSWSSFIAGVLVTLFVMFTVLVAIDYNFLAKRQRRRINRQRRS